MYFSIHARKAVILVVAVLQLITLNSLVSADATQVGESIGSGAKQVGDDIASGVTTAADATADAAKTGADATADAAKGLAAGISAASPVQMMLGAVAVVLSVIFSS